MKATSFHSMVGVVSAMVGLALAGAARAEITTVALYHCGEDGDDPTNCLIAAVGTNADMLFNVGTVSVVTGASGAPHSTKYLETYKYAWTPNCTYLYGQSYNWGMALWVKLPSAPISNDNLWYMAQGDFNANGLCIRNLNGTNYWNHGSDVAPVDPALWDTWAQVALVFNGNNKKQFYVNGAQVGSDTAANAVWRADSYGHLCIGTFNRNNVNTRFATPAIDEIIVFSFAEGAFEISDIYPSIWWSDPGVTNVTSLSAIAHATLVVDGQSNAVATLYWSTNDLGKTRTGWLGTNSLGTVTTGLVSNVALTGLRPRTNYCYRFYATNSAAQIQGWSDPAWFATLPPPAGTLMTVR